MTTALSIDSRFDGGAIDVLSCARADNIRLRIRRDSHADFCQWFYFCLSGARAKPCKLTFENAAQSSFPDWKDYRAFASYDQQQWFRVPTHYDGYHLRIEHTPEFDRVYYAYFEPYSEARHHTFLGTLQQCADVALIFLGRSVQERPITMVKVGTAQAGKKRIWIIARQHPGETMAQWFVEGLLERLTGQRIWAGDPIRHLLLEQAVFYIVPNMNPDGSALGNLRTNAAGANLNREWTAPDAQRSPEVLCVRNAIHETGCDLFFDIHGDEELRYVFPVQHLLQATAEQQRAYATFIESFKQFSPDFQTQHGYSLDRFTDEEKSTLASEYIGMTGDGLSLTLEMPFKDNANLPDAKHGWNGARSAALGAAMLAAIQQHLALHS